MLVDTNVLIDVLEDDADWADLVVAAATGAIASP